MEVDGSVFMAARKTEKTSKKGLLVSFQNLRAHTSVRTRFGLDRLEIGRICALALFRPELGSCRPWQLFKVKNWRENALFKIFEVKVNSDEIFFLSRW
jgi:hypothetical protein